MAARRARKRNPRGYIRYRGRWIASAPYYAHGEVRPMRRRRRRASANPPKRRRRRRRTRRNQWYGQPRRHRRAARLGWRRRRRARRNPGNPWYGQPRRHARASRLGWRRRRRTRRNPAVMYNPPRRRRRRARRNPHYGGRRKMRLLSNPLEAITSAFEQAFSGETIETLIHTGLGFGGSLAGSRLIYKTLITDLDTPVGRVGTTLGTSILGSGLVGMLTKDRDLTARWLVGGLMGTLWQGISEAVRDTKAADWIPTLGEGPETAEFRKAIEQEVLKELKGAGTSEYLPAAGSEGVSEYIEPAGVEEIYLTPAGSETYLTKAEGEEVAEAGSAAYLTEAEDEAVVGLGEGEFSRTGLPEQF